DGDDDDYDGKPLIAHIELFATSAPSGAWGVVQWQGSDGNWYDVEGWRGVLDSSGYRRWAVESKDFGTSLFRWQVRRGSATGTVVGTSETFALPSGAGESLQITVR
ncbi:MAG: hypothetical protein AAF485_27295, partial [Chloroflexota bacterium]